jgi:hypothetical protein
MTLFLYIFNNPNFHPKSVMNVGRYLNSLISGTHFRTQQDHHIIPYPTVAIAAAVTEIVAMGDGYRAPACEYSCTILRRAWRVHAMIELIPDTRTLARKMLRRAVTNQLIQTVAASATSLL